MADKKISQLPPAAVLTGDELIPVVQSGVTLQTTASAIRGDASTLPGFDNAAEAVADGVLAAHEAAEDPHPQYPPASALAGKADASHAHVVDDVDGLADALTQKQDALVSGTSLKTLNGASLLGAGDIAVAGGAGISDYQQFTSSGTWTKPAGATWVYVEAVGGGGGGANRADTLPCGGGGGGGFNAKLLMATDVPVTVTVTVGAAGAGGSTTSTADGGNGGNSTFGSLVKAGGGFGGGATSSPGTDAYYGRGGGGELKIRIIDTALAGGGGYSSGAGGHGTSGGDSVKGGAGGGGAAAGAGGRGTSIDGGSGGTASSASGVKASNGASPGGGGGASTNNGGGGSGGVGQVRIWCW